MQFFSGKCIYITSKIVILNIDTPRNQQKLISKIET